MGSLALEPAANAGAKLTPRTIFIQAKRKRSFAKMAIALRHGAGAVTLTARAGDGWVELAVADRGPGIDPAFARRAFERFSRADAARGPGGTGLGLAIVRAIAEAHDGAARLGARPGGGTEAVLRLPA